MSHWKMDNYMTSEQISQRVYGIWTTCAVNFWFFELFQNELISVQVYVTVQYVANYKPILWFSYPLETTY
jgi:hypothetical protein